MAHQEQKDFFLRVKAKYPEKFDGVNVIDCGSLDVNGSLKELFTNSNYIGVDITAGRNVDIVSKIHELTEDYHNKFDIVVSGEMLEHDEFWLNSLVKMYNMLIPGGLLAVSAAGPNRPEHGTNRTNDPLWGTSPSYYRNISKADFNTFLASIPPVKQAYAEYNNEGMGDIYFYVIK